jgi:group I intron endonuclease
MPRKKTHEEIIQDFHLSHGDFYDYSQVEYVNSSTKVKVICPVHGAFLIAPSHHKNGTGCRDCYFESNKITKDDFIKRSMKYFGNRYDYSLFDKLPPKKEMVSIKCNDHNIIFFQEPKSHMRGHTGCQKCLSLMLSGNQSDRGLIKTLEELNEDFINRSNTIHDNKYDYSKFKYVDSTTKGKIICPEHGVFWQFPSNHLRGNQCNKCANEKKKEGTFKKKCKEMGLNYHRALKRRQSGMSEDKIFSNKCVRGEREINTIIIFGEKYPNIEEAVRILNPTANSTTIGRWINNGMLPEEAFERIPNPGYADGIIYVITNKVTNMKYVGLTIQTLERRWKYHIDQAKSNQIKGAGSLHASIREFGEDSFILKIIDNGTTKVDLEEKEIMWIKKLGTIVPNGYNISSGGGSGGSNKKKTEIDGKYFESVGKAAEYLSESKGISLDAAKKRIATGRVNVKKPAKKGESLVKTKIYKTWSNIFHSSLNPKSKDHIPNIGIYEKWRDFDLFYKDVGNPPNSKMVFARLNKEKGYFPENCSWLTRCDAGKINAAYMKKAGLFKKSK